MKTIIDKNLESSTDHLLDSPQWLVIRHEGFSTSDWEVVAYGDEEHCRQEFDRLVAEDHGLAHFRLTNQEDVTVAEVLADRRFPRL